MVQQLITVIIPTLNAEPVLVQTLAALVPAAMEGIVRDVIIVDGGSSDETANVADHAGCTIVHSERGRGTQLATGPEHARGDWLLFLHADTVLEEGWHREVASFCSRELLREGGARAGAFRFRLNDDSLRAKFLEFMVSVRCALFALPYGDQGLLVHRSLYREIGGYRPIPLMEDVDMVRRIGRHRLVIMRSAARTSADRYQREGYVSRGLRNLSCLTLYFFGVSPDRIARLYS